MSSVAFNLAQDMMSAFPTPIIQVPVLSAGQINPVLKAEILQRESEQPSQERSNHGGWQSRSDLLTWPVPEVKLLTEAISDALKHMQKNICDVEGKQFDLSLKGWANVSRDGAYHSRHSHATSHWSGVYYVDAGDPDPNRPRSGILEVFDPRERVECAGLPDAPFGKSMGLPPVTGTLTVFPGWLYHSVNPYYGTTARISISFNAIFIPVKPQ